MNSRLGCHARSLAVLALLLAARPLAAAQLPASQPPPSPATPDSPAADETAEVDSDSPRASLRAFLEAARAADWETAGRYLSVPDDQLDRRAELAERLKAVLDRHHWFDLEAISPVSTGRLDDGLPAGVEEVGHIEVGDAGAVPLRMVRASDGRTAYWAFARNVVRQVDAWYGTLEGRWAIDRLAGSRFDALLGMGPFDIMWWQWIALLGVVLVAWAVGPVMGRVTRAVLRRLSARTRTIWDDRLFDRIGLQISIAWTLSVFANLVRTLGLSVPAETVIGHLVRGAGAITLFWALWRSVNVAVEVALTQPWASDSPSARHLLTIGSNLLKGAVVGFGILALLAALGYQVTTLLAGLGIGGLALAFGAQKTVENLFGSIALTLDQPFRVGDFVKVQDFVGTVEDVGLRSTRFRTLDRTLISIPNGSLADQRLESFSVRDRMRLSTTIGVEYGTSSAQMQQVLDGFERVLRQHPRIWPDAMVVKFAAFGASSLDIEIMAWFAVPTWGDFQQCRQEVLLGFMQVVEEAGTAFAFPTRTVHVVGAPAATLPS